MNDFLLLMHDDFPGSERPLDWEPYLSRLRDSGCFQGGSAIGGGACMRKEGASPTLTQHIVGYVRLQAESLEAAQSLVLGNPVFEAGGTVEVRELPRR